MAFSACHVGFVVQSRRHANQLGRRKPEDHPHADGALRHLPTRARANHHFPGALGVVSAIIGILCRLDSMRAFGALWLGTAAIAVAGAFLIARQQAIKDKEAFWSPPTRRVTQALWPLLLAGALLGEIPMVIGDGDAPPDCNSLTTAIWILFYGCALHAAGFFMPRGIKLFGLLFMASACVLLYAFFQAFLLSPFLQAGFRVLTDTGSWAFSSAGCIWPTARIFI